MRFRKPQKRDVEVLEEVLGAAVSDAAGPADNTWNATELEAAADVAGAGAGQQLSGPSSVHKDVPAHSKQAYKGKQEQARGSKKEPLSFFNLETCQQTLSCLGPQVTDALITIDTLCEEEWVKPARERGNIISRLLSKCTPGAARSICQDGISTASHRLQLVRPRLRNMSSNMRLLGVELQQAKGMLAKVGQVQRAKGLRGFKSHRHTKATTASRKEAKAEVKRLKGVVSQQRLAMQAERRAAAKVLSAKEALERYVGFGELELEALREEHGAMASKLAGERELSKALSTELKTLQKRTGVQDNSLLAVAQQLSAQNTDNRELRLTQQALVLRISELAGDVQRMQLAKEAAKKEAASASQSVVDLTMKLDDVKEVKAALELKAEEHKKETNQKLAKLKSKLEAAEAAKAAAEGALAIIRDEVTKLEAKVDQVQIAKGQKTAEIRELKRELQEYANKDAAYQKTLADLKAMTGLQTQVERLTVEKTTLNHRLTEASNTKAKAVKEKNEFQNKHKQATKEIKQLEKQVEALQAAAQEREEEVAAAHEEETERYNALAAEKAALEATLQQVTKSTRAALLADNAALKASLQEAKAKEEKQHKARSRLQDDVNKATRTITSKDAALAELRDLLTAKDDEIEAKQLEVTAILRDKILVDNKVGVLNGQLASSRNDLKDKQEAVRRLNQRVTELGQERDRFKAQAGGVAQQYSTKASKMEQEYEEMQLKYLNMEEQLVGVHRAKQQVVEEKEQLRRQLAYYEGPGW